MRIEIWTHGREFGTKIEIDRNMLNFNKVDYILYL